MDELSARLRALLRRDSKDKSSKICLNEKIVVDLVAKKVTKDDEIIKLSPTEYRIVECLVVNRGKAKNVQEIYETVWGNEEHGMLLSDSLKVHIARLRKKLGQDAIQTVPSGGYIIE